LITKKTTVPNKLGLHARAASKIVEVAQQFSADIQINNIHGTANAKSIMNMMMLQATFGSEFDLIIDGDDEHAAMEAMLCLIDLKFGEEE